MTGAGEAKLVIGWGGFQEGGELGVAAERNGDCFCQLQAATAEGHSPGTQHQSTTAPQHRNQLLRKVVVQFSVSPSRYPGLILLRYVLPRTAQYLLRTAYCVVDDASH
jgi:hypothetical protein